MRHLETGIPILGAAAILLGLAGCADESPWGNSSDQKGSISLSLSTDSGIKTAKPVFRSGEESRADDPNDLHTYINVPAASDFKVKLEKADGSYSKTWETLADFKSEAASTPFNTGAYTMTAYFGVKGIQDFEAPYFEASSSFTVLSDKTQEVNLEAELKNSMVKINYTQAFKDYMSNYYAMIHTEGRTDDITYGMVESRPAFLEPNKANITVHFTTKDKGFTSSVSLGEFAPSSKTLHNITFDVAESQNGTASLVVSFDETLEDEDITIDLTDELFTTPAPVITCEGFNNGETLDMLEGTGSNVTLKMNVKAEGKIKSAVLTVESGNYSPSWGAEYDLCKAFEENKVNEIKNAGIDAIGFGFTGQPTDMEGYLTLTDFGKSLPKGVHTISLTVTDQTGKVSEPATVILNSEEITIDMVGEPTIVYGSGQAVLTLDYNGINPNTDISFKAVGSDGYYTSTRIISCEEITATRAFEKKRYVYTVELPVTTKSEIGIQVFHKETKKVGEFQVPVTVPTYRIAEDAFSTYAYLKVTTPDSSDPSVLAAVINNLVVKGNGNELKIYNRDASKGIVTLSGLTPASDYTITSSITGDAWNNHDGFTTESELEIPNGEFTTVTQTINHKDVEVGGKYSYNVAYQATANIVISEPNDWASINAKTCWWESPGAKNTWFQVPSTYADKGKVIIRNVAYDHNGTKPAGMPTGLGKTYWYNTNVPTFTTFAAGELFLGSYSFDSSEHRVDGAAFSSRPSSIEFDCSYQPIGDDKASVIVNVKNSTGKTIATAEKLIAQFNNEKISVMLDNYIFGEKAAKIEICFRSSSSDDPKDYVHIPQGEELKEGFNAGNFGNKNLGDNNYHALATGSVLTVDNVKAVYGISTPAAAPKKSTNKKR